MTVDPTAIDFPAGLQSEEARTFIPRSGGTLRTSRHLFL